MVDGPGDARSFFLPELHLNLQGNHESWISLWNPHVQLGRPTYHTHSISQAYWLVHLLSWFSRDAWTVYTASALITLALSAVLAWLLFRELEIEPRISAACALAFAFSLPHARACAGLLFLSGSAWIMGLAWASLRLLRAPSAGKGLCLAFVVHSLLVSSYPQHVVYGLWYVGGLVLVALGSTAAWRGWLRGLGVLLCWGLLGCVASLFVHLDIAAKALESARLDPDDSFFTFGSIGWRERWSWFEELFDPTWNRQHHHGGLAGVTWTPLFGACALAGLRHLRSRMILYHAGFVLVVLLLTFFPPLHRFGVRFLGLSLSTFNPALATMEPIFVLAAFGLDRRFRRFHEGGPARLSDAACALLPAAYLAVLAVTSDRQPDPSAIAVSLAFSGAALWILLRPSYMVLGIAALAVSLRYGSLFMTTSPRALVEQWLDSPLAQEIRERTPGETRFAWVDSEKAALAPNTEQWWGLRSINSYDSLSSLRYQEWLTRLSRTGTRRYGRGFNRIEGTDGLAGEDFARAGVRLVLSRERLSSPVLRQVANDGDIRMYETLDARPLEAWIPADAFELRPDGAAQTSGPLTRSEARVERRAGPDERLSLALEPRSEPGLLWLSQQYHPRWRARSGSQALRTVSVDGFWQGVLVPPGTDEVELSFRPWVRWSWIPQAGFALGGVLLLVPRLRRTRARGFPG